MIIMMGLGQAFQAADGVAAPEPVTEITIDDFTRDRVLFDSGQAVGRNAASIPVSGTATAGERVELRVVTETGEADSWQEFSTSIGGVWSGEISLPRSSHWMRVEVRNQSEPTTRAVTSNRFGVGHVVALWGQSEIVRLRSTVFDTLAPEPLLDDESVQVMWFDDNPVIKHLTSADPHTSALAAMSNVFLQERPGEKFAIIFHAQSGTGFTALVDDTNTDRDWLDDAQLHAFATADGQQVGMPAVSWFAAPSGFGAFYDDALFPLFTGKTLDGTDVTFPTVLNYGTSGTLRADHWFGELYDPAHTRWIGYGPHRFDISGDMQSATVQLDGSTQSNLVNKQTSRQAWREMMENPMADSYFLPLGLEPLSYSNGTSDGSGGWLDFAHPSGDSDDGAPQLARLTAYAILQSSGLLSWNVPEFDQSEWEPSGAYVEFWSSLGPVTTTRIARGEPALDDSYPHWTEVFGWQINGRPAERAEISSGRVRVYPSDSSFTSTDIINFGEGGATGMIKFPQDYYAQTYKDLPIVDLGVAGIEGIPLRPLPDAAILANTLAPTDAVFSVSATGPYFVDPSNIGAGVSALQVRMDLSLDLASISGARTLFALSGNYVKLEILPSGTLRLRVRDSGGVVHLSNVGSTSNAMISGVDASLVCALDLAAGVARIWVDGVEVLSQNFTSMTPTFSSNRTLSVFASTSGASQSVSSVRSVDIWKEASGDAGDPASAPWKALSGSSATVNVDPWKRGDDAS